MSQLGLIFVSIGLSCYLIAFIHLVIHAFFKALIFISTGNLIHHRIFYQSILKTGNLSIRCPLNMATNIVAAIRLIGAPFAASFFSKEPILEIGIFNPKIGFFFRFLALLRVRLTIFYSMRIVKNVFFSFNKKDPLFFVNEHSTLVNKRIFFLLIPSFSSGAIINFYFMFLPSGLNYPQYFNTLLSRTILVRIFILINQFKFYKDFERSFFNISRTPIFSNKIFNLYGHFESMTIKSYSYIVINYTIISLTKIKNSIFLEPILFWRALLAMPAILIIIVCVI